MSHPCRRTSTIASHVRRGPGDPAGREERAEDLGGGRPEHVGVAAALGWLAVIALTAVSVKTVSGRRG
jgi:hypothetical protein